MNGRRDLLGSAMGVGLVAISGCIGSLDPSTAAIEEKAARHSIDVANGSEERHVITVTVLNDDEEAIFEHAYDLGPLKEDESKVIDGDPEAFTVTVDDEDPVAFQWEPKEGQNAYPDGCSDATTTSLNIYYQRASAPTITPIYGCETVV